MAYSLAKPRGAADRASPDGRLPLPLEDPGVLPPPLLFSAVLSNAFSRRLIRFLPLRQSRYRVLVVKRPLNSGKSTIFGGRGPHIRDVFGVCVASWRDSLVKTQVSFMSTRCHPKTPNSEPPIIVHLPEFAPGFPTRGLLWGSWISNPRWIAAEKQLIKSPFFSGIPLQSACRPA